MLTPRCDIPGTEGLHLDTATAHSNRSVHT